MYKRNTSIFILVMFIFAILPSTFYHKVHAYTSNSYFSNPKVGLTSMSATSIKINLNGNYTLNGQFYSSGSVLNLGISGTSVTLNGLAQSQIILIPNSQSNLLTITSGSVSNKYMGSFLIKVYNAKLLPINTLDMENYLKGVVGYEMSDYFPMEALKAQAVAARNYALSKLSYEALKGYDFDDTIHYQVYKGYNSSYTRVHTAVDATKGQVLLYNDKLVETLYSAWHGGISENSENVWGNTVPYLRSVEDAYENAAWPNGNRVLTNTQIQSTLITKGLLTATDTFEALDLNSITNYASGRVSNINIIYKNVFGLLLTKFVARDNTRTFLSLPSNLYTVSYDLVNKTYTFSGKGNGHGLGMSQIGAKNRATAGQTYDNILKFYYQNTYLQNLIRKASLTSLTQSTSSLSLGDTVSFNSTATSGNGYGYLFKYVLKTGSNVVFTKEYSSNSSLYFVPSSVGSYTIEAYVKDKFSISDYDDKKESTFSVYEIPIDFAPLTITSFTKDRENISKGDVVNFSTKVAGGSNSETNYKFQVLKDGAEVFTRDYSTISSLQYVPKLSGNYQVNVFVVDSLSTNKYDDVKSLSFIVQTKANTIKVYSTKLSTITAVGSFYASKPITLNAHSTGSSTLGSRYKYVVYKNTTQVAANNFSKSSTFKFTATAPGTYTVKVYGKDGLSTKGYDSMKQFKFTINSKPLYLSQTPLKLGMKSNNVVSLQKTLIKLGYKISDKSGYFGAQTKNRVIAFQKSKKLTKDGIVGSGTYNSLNEALIQKSAVKTLTY